MKPGIAGAGSSCVGAAVAARAPGRAGKPRLVPIIGIRTVEQLEDNLGCLDVALSAEHLARLDEVSRIDLGFPYSLLAGAQGRMVYGDLEPAIDLPRSAPIRWARAG